MPYLIPDDWNGEDWICVKLDWPNSPAFMGILRGVITSFMRGRLWDETTGTITEIQEIGWEIFERNYPFRACENGQECPDCHPVEPSIIESEPNAYIGLPGDCEDEEMPMVGTIIDIRCEGGVLQVKRFPCCEWEDVCTGFSGQEPIPDIPPWEENDTFSACGKAAGIVYALYLIATAVWSNKDGSDYFLSIGAIDNALPQYDLNNNGILGLLNGARSLDDVYEQSEFLNDTYRLELQCRIAPLLTADDGKLTDAQYTAILDTVTALYPEDTTGWWRGLVQTFGQNILSQIAIVGAGDLEADCTCPGDLDPYEEPTVGGWYLGEVLPDVVIINDGTEGWKQACIIDTPVHDVFGYSFSARLSGDVSAQWSQQSTAGGPCDGVATIWGDSSQPGSNFNCCGGAVAVLDEIFGVGQWTPAHGGQTWSSDYNTPDHLGGGEIGGEFVCGWNKSATLVISNFRFIHNINSPSHS